MFLWRAAERSWEEIHFLKLFKCKFLYIISDFQEKMPQL